MAWPQGMRSANGPTPRTTGLEGQLLRNQRGTIHRSDTRCKAPTWNPGPRFGQDVHQGAAEDRSVGNKYLVNVRDLPTGRVVLVLSQDRTG